MRGGGAPRRRGGLRDPLARVASTCRGACEAPAPPCDRGRSTLGAPPAVLWCVSALPCPVSASWASCSELLAKRVVLPEQRFPHLPRRRCERHRGNAGLAPPSGTPPDGGPSERG